MWDIVQRFRAEELSQHVYAIGSQVGILEFAKIRREQNRPVTPDSLRGTVNTLARFLSFCDGVGFRDVASKLQLSLDRIERSAQLDGSYLECEYKAIFEALQIEILKHQFLELERNRQKYFNADSLFGSEVREVLPEAESDIREAGNCLALERDTAAVFHLMRAAERGLRRLAKRLRVKVVYHGNICAVEYADWGAVTAAVQTKLTQIRKTPKGRKLTEQLELYSDAADHCTFMKDIWRNTTSHTRKPYTHGEALAAFDRVRDFMVFLARSLQKMRP